jgi:N-acetylglucosaminyl-diphospho-decaprenol L-rhamnosyltransferase
VIHVVIVAFRSDGVIHQCLRPLLADQAVSRIVVVDNSSDPATAEACRGLREGPRLIYVANRNVGYAQACNLGARLMPADAEFIAIVNPDVMLDRTLSELAERSRKQTGSIYSAVLKQRHGTVNARPMAEPRRELCSAFVGSRAYATYLPSPKPIFERVPQIDGSLLLIPSLEYRALGGFDERFELYFEDVDLCRRANLRNGCYLFLEEWGLHVGGASFAVAGASPFLTLRASRVRYLLKWYRWWGAVVALLVAGIEFPARGLTGAAPSHRTLARALWVQAVEIVQPGRRRYLTQVATPRGRCR